MIQKETVAIYSAALFQGICLVAFPAASTILTSPHAFDFSSTVYGSLFIPQSLLSIAAAALNPTLTRYLGSKQIFLCGLFANALSMILLACSAAFMRHYLLSHSMLLVATGCLGLGFGLTVPTLNAMAALLYPTRVDSILLFLNALLGIGTALAPFFITLFVALGFWWGLPLFLTVAIVILLLASWHLVLPGSHPSSSPKTTTIPSRVWIFAAFALLYGIIETINGNWISIYLKKHLQATLALQSLALMAFWGMVTFGRVFFAAIEKIFHEQLAYTMSPFVAAIAFLIIASVPEGRVYVAVFAFGLIGFACSVLLPLTMSFAGRQLKSIASSVPGMVISFYLLGYGIAAFGVGPLQDIAHISLRAVYVMGAVIACILGGISFVITRRSNI